MGNTFGTIFRLTSFGESHGLAMGGVIDGMPAGIRIDMERIQHYVDRRRPGVSSATSRRAEDDRVEVLSGIFEGKTLGTPIGFIVRNKDMRSADYEHLRDVYRPSHADYTYQAKYGVRDYRGGGRASARETVCRVVAGAFAVQVLEQLGIKPLAYASQIGNVRLPSDAYEAGVALDGNVYCPDSTTAERMLDAIDDARKRGDTLGGVVTCVVTGVPCGLGEPVYDKLSAALGMAMMSIPAAKSFELGGGRMMTGMNGSETLDTMRCESGIVQFDHNWSGGIQGGISNGNDVCFEVGFKPIPTLMRDVDAVDVHGHPVTLHPHGRHDVCAVPRAVPVVEAMAAMVILDFYMLNQAHKLS